MKYLLAPIFFIFYISSVYPIGPNTMRVTGIDCKPTPNWTTVEICNLKLDKDRQVKVNLRVMIIRPVVAVQVRFQIFRWYSGFKPFLVDFWADGCKMMERNAKVNALTKVLTDLIRRHSNLNHSCPYSGEVIMPSVPADLGMFKSLIQSGTYKLVITYAEKTHDQVIFVFSVKGIISSSEL